MGHSHGDATEMGMGPSPKQGHDHISKISETARECGLDKQEIKSPWCRSDVVLLLWMDTGKVTRGS